MEPLKDNIEKDKSRKLGKPWETLPLQAQTEERKSLKGTENITFFKG